MKRKIKFNNQNFKHKFKFFVLAFIILASVYFLYFNDKLLVQSIVQNSLQTKDEAEAENKDDDEDDTNKSNIKENFDVSKYVDICKNRKTRFYEFRSASTPLAVHSVSGTNNCENLCDTTPNCQFFTMKENDQEFAVQGLGNTKKCYLYSRPLNSKNIDTNNMNIKVNCNSTILPTNISNDYNGFGYVNKKYFEHNKNKFTYKDAYLDEANKLITTIKANRSNLNALRRQDGYHSELTANAVYDTRSIGSWITSFGDLIGFDTNKLTSLNNSTDLFREDILNDDKNKELIKLAAIAKETPELENKLADVKNRGYSNNLFYTILGFIMIITIILLILYKLDTNIISDRFMIVYFIVIVIIFMFIRFLSKK